MAVQLCLSEASAPEDVVSKLEAAFPLSLQEAMLAATVSASAEIAVAKC